MVVEDNFWTDMQPKMIMPTKKRSRGGEAKPKRQSKEVSVPYFGGKEMWGFSSNKGEAG